MKFYLLGEIEESKLEFIEKIHDHLALSQSLDEPDWDIEVVISSAGGDETVGYAIYDTLMAYGAYGKVTTVGYGEVSSIASLILQAGGIRLLSPNCQLMIHNGTIHSDKPVDLKLLKEMDAYFKQSNLRYCDIIAKKGGISLDKVIKWCDDETYFTAQEAVKAKLADKIARKL